MDSKKWKYEKERYKNSISGIRKEVESLDNDRARSIFVDRRISRLEKKSLEDLRKLKLLTKPHGIERLKVDINKSNIRIYGIIDTYDILPEFNPIHIVIKKTNKITINEVKTAKSRKEFLEAKIKNGQK